MHALHKIHPNMSKAKIITHVVKHKILGKMVGSPKWHHAQLDDMMAMVDTYVLLQLFLTISSNETLEFKWSNIFNMKTYLKKNW